MDRVGGDEISGYLHKRRGGFGKHMPNAWQPRYFIVRDGWMYYFEEKKLNVRPRGRIDLRSELVTLVVNLQFEHAPTPYTMLINPGGYEEKWRLCAANKVDMEQWCACIKSHINNKKKRKTAELDLPEYDSDHEHDDDADGGVKSEDQDVMIHRLPQAPPSLAKTRKISSLISKKKKNVSPPYLKSESGDTSSVSSQSKVVGTQSSDAIKRKSSGNKLRVKTGDSSSTDTIFEIVITLILLNLCGIYAVLTDKVGFSAFYFIVGNLITARTMYLFSTRIDKLTKELKSMTTLKEKAENSLEKVNCRVMALEDIVRRSPDAKALFARGDDQGILDVDGNESESSVVNKLPPVPGMMVSML